MTKPLRAENQPRAARYQPRDPPPDEDEPVHAGIQARLNAHPGLRAQDQARPADFNMDYGDYFRAKEQPKAFTNNFATDNARVLNGNVWTPIPYLDGLNTAYETCGEMLESIINSTTPSIPFTILSELTSLNTLVKEKQKLLAEHKDNLFIGRWMYESKQSTPT